MDRTVDSGSTDVGSTPARDTKQLFFVDLRKKLPVLGSIRAKSESDLNQGFKQVTKGKPRMLFAQSSTVVVKDKSQAD